MEVLTLNNVNKKQNESKQKKYEKTESKNQIYGTLVGREGRLGHVLAKKVEKKDQNVGIPESVPFFLEGESFYIFIFKHVFLGPDQDLPRFYLERKDGSMIFVDPARKILNASSLTSYASQGILIPKENKFMDILEPLHYLSPTDDVEKIQHVFQLSRFDFLLHLANNLEKEATTELLPQFVKKYKDQFRENDKTQILRVIAKLIQTGLDPDKEDIKETIKLLISDENNSLSIDFKNNQITGIMIDKLDLGDLVVFEDGRRQIVTVLTNSGKICTFSPLFQIEDDSNFNRRVSSLSYGSLGSKKVIEEVFEKFIEKGIDKETVEIPVGSILNTDISYKIQFHPKKINHSIIAAISGGGKGNLNKIIAMNNAFLPEGERLAMILFDDVPEFKEKRSDTEWGLNCLEGIFTIKAPKATFPIIFINPINESDFKLSLIHIPAEEIIYGAKGLRAENAFYAARHFYYTSDDEHIPVINGKARYDKITPNLLQWILFDEECKNCLLKEKYSRKSIEVMQRTVRSFLRNNSNFLKAMVDYKKREIKNDEIGNKTNLIDQLIEKIKQRMIVVIDQSDLNDFQKLAIQRSIIFNILEFRENYSPKEKALIPCQIIIEEATSTMEEQASDQLKIFRKVQTKARKFGIGLTLVLQHSEGLDQRLISQLGWMVALPIPSDGIRSKLIKNAAGDFGPFDSFIKNAPTGQGVFCQNQRLSYLPVPVKIWHYEREVEFKYLEIIKDISPTLKPSVEKMLKDYKLPMKVINRIIKEEGENAG